jgi:hypothetical protein
VEAVLFSTSSAARAGVWGLAPMKRIEKRKESLQDRDPIVREVLNLLIPPRDLERRRITPTVIIKGKEITPLIIRPTVHILRHLQPIAIHIRSRVAHRDLSIAHTPNILSHIPRNRLNIRRRRRRRIVIDNLIPTKER